MTSNSTISTTITTSIRRPGTHRQPRQILPHSPPYYANAVGTFYASISLHLPPPTATSSTVKNPRSRHHRDSKNCQRWILRIGDTLAVEDLNIPTSHSSQANTTKNSPFHVPWSPAQILCLYKNASDEWHMIVRWLYRTDQLPRGDIPAGTETQTHPSRKRKNGSSNTGLKNLVFEYSHHNHYHPTNKVNVMRALGRVVMGSKNGRGRPTTTHHLDGIPYASLTCQGHIQNDQDKHVHGTSVGDDDDWQGCGLPDLLAPYQRGLALLPDTEYRQATLRAVTDMMERSEDDDSVNSHHDHDDGSVDVDEHHATSMDSNEFIKSDKWQEMELESACASPCQSLTSQSTTSTVSCIGSLVELGSTPIYQDPEGSFYYSSLHVQVPLRHYHEDMHRSPRLTHGNNISSPTLSWELAVGDVITVCYRTAKMPPTVSSDLSPWYPFATPWSPAQIVSLRVDANGAGKMRVRWFYRHVDLTKTQQRTIRSKDDQNPRMVYENNFVDEVHVKRALGRIVLTSRQTIPPQTLNQHVGSDGIPQVHLICCQGFGKRGVLHKADDWDNHRRFFMSRSFLRSLRCLGLRKLTEATSLALEQIGSNPLMLQNGREVVENEVNVVPECSLPVPSPNCCVLLSTMVEGDIQRDFLDSITIPVPVQYCAPRVVSKAGKTKCWTVQVGEIVCIQSDDANPQADFVLKQHENNRMPEAKLWHPFVVPWTICQILTLYQDNGGDTLMEIRWFYRPSDVPASVQNRMPPPLNTDMEEIFETDHVEVDVPISKILGHVNLYFGRHDEAGNRIPKTPAPSVDCRCRYFFVTDMSIFHFQHIACSETTPRAWFHRAVLRGMHVSELIETGDALWDAVTTLRLGANEEFSMNLATQDDGSNEQIVETSPGCQHVIQISIVPPWEQYYLQNVIFTGDNKGLIRHRWDVTVGDIVAVHCKDSKNSEYFKVGAMWYPYLVEWSPCQILAICRDDDKSEWKVEVRWFYRPSDLPKKARFPRRVQNSSQRFALDVVYELVGGNTEMLSISSLLGPLTMVTLEGKSTDVPGTSPYLPQALHLYGGIYHLGTNKFKETPCSTYDIVDRGVQHSSRYATKTERDVILHTLLPLDETLVPEQQHVDSAAGTAIGRLKRGTVQEEGSDERPNKRPKRLKTKIAPKQKKPKKRQSEKRYKKAVDDFVADNDGDHVAKDLEQSESQDGASGDDGASVEEKDENEQTRVRVDQEHLFHVDVSSLRSYYSKLTVIPPYHNYAIDRANSDGDGKWTVTMGDLAIIHWEIGAGKTHFQSSHGEAHSTHFPFRVPWAVGEIVTIWKAHDTKADVVKLKRKFAAQSSRNSSRPDCCEDDKIMIEVRWLYRKGELPGSTKLTSNAISLAGTFEYEEVFETDHLDDCTAASLLAPADLQSSATRIEKSRTRQGMPVIDIYCHRFWSIHRKSLIPCGDSDGLTERGRLYSKYFGENEVLKAAFKVSTEAGAPTQVEKLTSPTHSLASNSWREGFSEVIKKLSLSDASEDTAIKGMHLIGREREQEKIMSFLRSGICGATFGKDGDAESAMKSSIFIAGPPGTGKTASVRSVIAQLRHEQANGDIPAFDFVSLNGMEMRHPFEAYVKLWEILSGPRKEKRSPEVAAALLERHFTGHCDDDDHHANGVPTMTVLLLDEIDYLVTKKQTVLYNFFDWPRRASGNRNGPRLIVVGISNTLNLPDRLKPSVQSRLGGERCDFKSYNVQDMVRILEDKIHPKTETPYTVFEKDAILFAARKTAALSGDIRKALQICKAAAESVVKMMESGEWIGEKNGPVVRISDVQKVSRESFSSVLSRAVSLTTPFECLLLVSLASLARTSGRENGGFDIKELVTKMDAVAGGTGDLRYLPPPTFGETLELLNQLGESRLVSLYTPTSTSTSFRASQGGSGGAWPLISLPMDASNILAALRDTPHQQLAEKHLGTTDFF